MRMIARASGTFALASFHRQRSTLRSWRRKLSIKKIECLTLKPVLLAQAERQEAGGRPLQYLNEPTRRKIWPDRQRDTPKGGPETSSIRQISPVRVTTYAVFPMNSSEVGRFRPSVMTVKVPSPLTFTSAPESGCAGEPAGAPSTPGPCESA